MIVEITPPF